jgi:hypothetical protein
MKRFRLGTLLLLVIIAALIMVLVVQDRRAARREAELNTKIQKLEVIPDMIQWHEMNERRLNRYRPIESPVKRPAIEPMEFIEKGKR